MAYKSVFVCDECKEEYPGQEYVTPAKWWKVKSDGPVFTFCSLICLVPHMERYYMKTKGG